MSIISLMKYSCDYCGKSEDEVAILITGQNNAAICDACVGVCVGVIAESQGAKAAPKESSPCST